jgi:hypothetical protein
MAAALLVEAVCPDMIAGRRIDELGSNAHLVARLPDAAFDHIVHL